ncbi:hypothetical protein EUX98_g5893 [Antrodiella citrinella]|uniref:cellulase n=1 Tax=Antrodiella citrinella TaxID=2447956 RepID=A0A4S4MQB8_9APHY|nr:hypothetical protein EUX98_g5893 [Antrodiella citrinella]
MLHFSSSLILLATVSVALAQQQEWAQCGGIGWSGATTCVSGTVCTELNSYYSQCIPGAAPPPSTTAPTTGAPAPTATGALIRLGGVNTAGYDFSVATNGSFTGTGVSPPTAQYTHFAGEGANLFRIPFAWQLMTPTLGGSIDQGFLSEYDATVQSALSSGPNVFVIVDVHNYARWNGGVIGQGGPTNAQFISLWTQLVAKYGQNERIIFGIMNEPHDLPSVATWVDTVQQVVTAVRTAGATNFLLLPGSSYSSAQAFPTEAGPLLVQVTDPLGNTDKLIFDVHKYLDSDNSGTHADCVTDNVDVLTTLVQFLQANGNRQALLSETGGGNTASCEQMVGTELAFVKTNYPTLAGFAVWAAGAFDDTYVLSVSPDGNTDQPLWTQAVLRDVIMPAPKGKKSSGLGRAIINRKVKDARRTHDDSGLYITDVENTTRLMSITQERDLDEFLNTATLAGTQFTAERRNVKVISAPAGTQHNPYLLSEEEEKKALQKHQENKEKLRVPRRPAWTKTLTTVQLDRQEKDAFLDWRRGLAQLSEQENLLLTPFERNIEVWRQLWRVLERSHLVVQIVDARNPLRFRCEDLESYVKDVEGSEGESETGKDKRKNLLLINKSDLLTSKQRRQWADYFDAQGVQYAFYSAANAAALQKARKEEQEAQERLEAREGAAYSGDRLPVLDDMVDDDGDDSEDDSEDGDLWEDDSEDGSEDDSDNDIFQFEDESDDIQDPRARVLSVLELEELFLRVAPDLGTFADSNGNAPTKVVVGLVGYPNVGKSSTINSLIGEKKVSVSSTPGKTKHFQTIQLSPAMTLCDCPGLVFPQFTTTRADLVCDGVLPIDQLREFTGPISLVTQRIPKEVLEATYGLTIKVQLPDEGGTGEVTAENFLISYAVGRGFTRSGQGNPDEARAARVVLKDYVNAKILFCHAPPGIEDDIFNQQTREICLRRAAGKKRAPVTRVGKGADTFIAAPRGPDTEFTCMHLSQARKDRPDVFNSVTVKEQSLGRWIVTSHSLGSGSFATVRLAMDTSQSVHRQVACKTIKRKQGDRRNTVVKEAQILGALNHPNINRVYDVVSDSKHIHIFLELCTGGDLFSYIAHYEATGYRLCEGEAQYIMYQLLQGLEYLHDRLISHRDLKPENILLYSPGPYPRIQIADFGLARPKSYQETLNVCGTVPYLPPEGIVALDNKLMGYVGIPADCWSAGVIMYLMLS